MGKKAKRPAKTIQNAYLGSTLSKVPMSSRGSTLLPLIQLKGPLVQSVLIGMVEQAEDLRMAEEQVRETIAPVREESILKIHFTLQVPLVPLQLLQRRNHPKRKCDNGNLNLQPLL